MAKTDPSPQDTPQEASPLPASECPHLGGEYNPFSGPHLQNPYPFFARLRREAPVTFHPMLGLWLISRRDDILAVLDNASCYSSVNNLTAQTALTPEAQAILGPGPLLTDRPFNTDPPVHTRLRRLLQGGLLPERVAHQAPRIRQLAHALIDQFIQDGWVDLIEKFTSPLSMQVILGMVGIPSRDMARVQRWSEDLFSLLFTQVPPEAQPALARSIVTYRAYCAELIAQRRQQPEEDLISYLANTRPDGESLTMPELISLIGGALVGAGHEVSSAQLGLILRNLLAQPERWRMLREAPTLIPQAVEECIRLEAAPHGMVRTATEDVVVGGVLLPKGSRLLLLYSSANHDERHYAAPERFEPHRPEREHLGFGHGLHACVGVHLARLELCIAVELLLERLPELRLVPHQDPGYHQELLILRNIRQLLVEWPVERLRTR